MSVMDLASFRMIFGVSKKIPIWTGPHGYLPIKDMCVLVGLTRCYTPRVVVEFGINEGKTARVLLDSFPCIERYIGIDVPPGFNTTLRQQKFEVPMEAGKYVKDDKRVQLIILENGSKEVVPEMIAGVNMAFIDADHSYDGVKRDTMLVDSVMKEKGGIIVWHDYCRSGLGVKKFIDERNQRYNSVCLVLGTDICFEVIKAQTN